MIKYSQYGEKRGEVCQWPTHMRLSRIVLMVLIILILTPLFTHFYLSNIERNIGTITHSAHSHIDLPDEFIEMSDSDLKVNVEELLRIKGSVMSELRDMEFKRQKLLTETQSYMKSIEELKQELTHQQTNLNKLKISVEQAQVAQREALEQNTPDLTLPFKLLPQDVMEERSFPSPSQSKYCRMFKCFDHSRCSLTSGFPVYLYEPDEFRILQKGWDIDGFLKTTLKQALGYNPHLTANPKEACIYLVLIGEALRNMESVGLNSSNPVPSIDSTALKKLKYWGGDGRNHVLLNLARRDLTVKTGNIFESVDIGESLFTITINFYKFFNIVNVIFIITEYLLTELTLMNVLKFKLAKPVDI